ncbi:MAG: hypothetical protein F6K17_01320 [Okeania sp. SIO3C4]|nr:hypothetical protein [Okeania sp. SIO3C4]
MSKFIHHDYDKNSKTCRLCGREFKAKPRVDNCPGVPIRNSQQTKEATHIELGNLNRKLKNGAMPVAYDDWKDYSRSKKRDESLYVYNLSETEIIDPTLPPAYYQLSNIPKEQKPISENTMRAKGLEPKENAKPIAVTREWGKDHKSGEFYQYWEYYYNKDDTQPGDSLNYITKGRLKSEYHLSDGWLKRLGKPDVYMENPHFSRSASMKLYKISRVRGFLKTNAEDYAQWLVRREKFVIHSKRFAEKHKIARERRSHQNELCLKCRSSTFLENGIFCAVHPIGLPEGVPEDNYCPDYSAFEDSEAQ